MELGQPLAEASYLKRVARESELVCMTLSSWPPNCGLRKRAYYLLRNEHAGHSALHASNG